MAFDGFLGASYALYGLRVTSNQLLPGLTISDHTGTFDLHVLLQQKAEFASKFNTSPSTLLYTSRNSDPDDTPALRVCTLNDAAYFVFSYSDGVRFAVAREGHEIWGDWPDGYALEDACTYLIGPVIGFALRLRGAVCLHASSIAVCDRAIALLGVPGAGKSTTAAAFARRGFPILSDDVVVLADQGGSILVQPGYARINIWPDSVRALFGSEDALPRITPTWGKRFLTLNQSGYRFQTEPLPLGAVYLLGERRDADASPIVEEIRGQEALLTLVTNSYVNYLLDARMRSREFEVLSRLIAEIPIHRVTPAGDPSKVFELCEAIASNARQLRSRDKPATATKAD